MSGMTGSIVSPAATKAALVLGNTACRSRLFSSSNALSRLTWSFFMPPYFARQRKYVVSVTEIVFTASAIDLP